MRPCNLHAAWDFYMIDTRLDDYGPPPINYTVVDPREGLWTADIITEMEGMYVHLLVLMLHCSSWQLCASQ